MALEVESLVWNYKMGVKCITLFKLRNELKPRNDCFYAEKNMAHHTCGGGQKWVKSCVASKASSDRNLCLVENFFFAIISLCNDFYAYLEKKWSLLHELD